MDDLVEHSILLVMGFIFTGLLGGMWGYVLKRRSWIEETRHSLYQARYEEGSKFLDELSELIGRRFYLLQRLLWAFEEQDAERIKICEVAYFDAVNDWNTLFWRNRNKIRLLVGEEQANAFLDYGDDYLGDRAQSLHYKFVLAHRKVIAAKAGAREFNEARRQVVELNWKCSVFLERLTSTFVERANELRLLEVPSGPGAAERALPDSAEGRDPESPQSFSQGEA